MSMRTANSIVVSLTLLGTVEVTWPDGHAMMIFTEPTQGRVLEYLRQGIPRRIVITQRPVQGPISRISLQLDQDRSLTVRSVVTHYATGRPLAQADRRPVCLVLSAAEQAALQELLAQVVARREAERAAEPPTWHERAAEALAQADTDPDAAGSLSGLIYEMATELDRRAKGETEQRRRKRQAAILGGSR